MANPEHVAILKQGDRCPVDRTFFQRFYALAQKPIRGVEVRDLEHFVLERPEPHAPEVLEVSGIRKRVTALAALLKVKRGSCLYDLEGDRCNRPDSRDGAQSLGRSVQDATEVSKPLDQSLCRLFHVRARNRQGEEQLDHLVVGEAGEARFQKALTEALSVTEVVGVASAHTESPVESPSPDGGELFSIWLSLWFMCPSEFKNSRYCPHATG